MVAFTITPSRAAARLNSGVRHRGNFVSQAETALLVALIAAGASLGSLFWTSRATRLVEGRTTRRALLNNEFNELGHLLYRVVALSKKMTDTGTDANFATIRTKAIAVSKEIDDLRLKCRYALWGLDDGFRTIKWMPVYIAHMKDNRKSLRANKLIKLGTKLRHSMDKAICHSYFNGAPPSFLSKLLVMYRAWRLRVYFDNGKPVPLD